MYIRAYIYTVEKNVGIGKTSKQRAFEVELSSV